MEDWVSSRGSLNLLENKKTSRPRPGSARSQSLYRLSFRLPVNICSTTFNTITPSILCIKHEKYVSCEVFGTNKVFNIYIKNQRDATWQYVYW